MSNSFEKYMRLRDLLEHVSSEAEFLEAIQADGNLYAVDGWTREDYGYLFERIKGGHKYGHEFTN